MAALHTLDWRAAGLAALGRPAGYAARQVAGWTTRYAAARTGPVPDVDQAVTWTSLAYWLAPPDDPPALRTLGLGLTAAPGSPSRGELVAAYGRTTGRDVGDVLWY